MEIRRSLSRHFQAKDKFSDRVHGDLLANMYFQDWTNDLLDFDWGQKSGGLKIAVAPDTQRDFLKKLLTRKHETETLETALYSFVKEVGQCLILYNGAAYELCEKQDENQTEFFLDLVSIETIKIENGQVIQYSPNYETDEIEINKLSDARKLLLIRPPSWIEGGRGFRGVIQELFELSKQEFSILDFMRRQVRGEKTSFDLNKFRLKHDQASMEITRNSGWFGRTLHKDKISEFYYFHRYLRFKKAQAQLRDYIFYKINEFLGGLGSLGLPQTSFAVEGLVSVSNIEDLLKQLEEGKVSFEEIIKKVKP